MCYSVGPVHGATGRGRRKHPSLKKNMVLSTDSYHAYVFELPDLVVHREPWHPAWHPGYVSLVYKQRPVQPILTRRREVCANAAVKCRRYSTPVPTTWVHPWVLEARHAQCVQGTNGADEKIDP